MSFCFAEKISFEADRKCIESVHILCDTKICLEGAIELNWNTEARHQLQKYGIAKTIILNQSTCLSFTGNKIERVYDLLSWLENNSPCEVDDFVSKALDVHRCSADINDIEFLITLKESANHALEIVSIKNGVLSRNCDSAWIGSYEAFHYLQGIRVAKNNAGNTSIAEFWDAVEGCEDETVGGYPIEVCFVQDHFEYATAFTTYAGKPQVVRPGEAVVLVQDAEDGGFTVSSYSYEGEPLLCFEQGNFSVLYTRRYRYYGSETYHPAAKYLLLPVLIDSNTGEIIWQRLES